MTTYFGFALADSMFTGDCTIARYALTPNEAVNTLRAARAAGVLSPALNPSHKATIDAMRLRYGIDVDIPETAPKVQMTDADSLVVMGVRGLPRLDATRHEYTAAEISAATFEFSLYQVR